MQVSLFTQIIFSISIHVATYLIMAVSNILLLMIFAKETQTIFVNVLKEHFSMDIFVKAVQIAKFTMKQLDFVKIFVIQIQILNVNLQTPL